MSHYAQLVVELTILALAIFLGIEVISKVPTLLHTPLMSGTNAIHGIVIVGAMLVAGTADPDSWSGWIGFVAMILARANVVGGFVVTDRMLEMFKRPGAAQERGRRPAQGDASGPHDLESALPDHDHLLRPRAAGSSPRRRRRGAATGSERREWWSRSG